MFEIIDHQGPAVGGPRVRELTNWRLFRREDDIPFLLGQTVSENGTPVTGRIRLTETSTIVSIQGRTATTLSGSQYILLTAHPDQPDGGDPAFVL